MKTLARDILDPQELPFETPPTEPPWNPRDQYSPQVPRFSKPHGSPAYCRKCCFQCGFPKAEFMQNIVTMNILQENFRYRKDPIAPEWDCERSNEARCRGCGFQPRFQPVNLIGIPHKSRVRFFCRLLHCAPTFPR